MHKELQNAVYHDGHEQRAHLIISNGTGSEPVDYKLDLFCCELFLVALFADDIYGYEL